MKASRLAALAFAASLVFLQSCNFPRPTPTPQAAVPVTGGTATQPTVTLAVRASTNCRAGPGKAYPLVFTVKPGSSFVVVGKNSARGDWIITNPVGGTCWVSGRNAIITGNAALLPEHQAPPRPTQTPTTTPTPAANNALPGAPGALLASRSCARGTDNNIPVWVEDVILTWQPGTAQAGYHVYRNNQPVTAVTADSTTANIEFTYSVAGTPAPADVFSVEAYNVFGNSALTSANVARCS